MADMRYCHKDDIFTHSDYMFIYCNYIESNMKDISWTFHGHKPCSHIRTD